MEIKELEGVIESKFTALNKQVEDSVKSSKTEIGETKSAIEALRGEFESIKEGGVTLDQLKALQSHVDGLDCKLQGKSGRNHESKSFNDIMSETIKENASKLSQAAKTRGVDLTLEMKAAGDMSYTSNFANGSAGPMTTEYRQNVLVRPDKTKYLREIIPGGQTDANMIWYPKHVGGEGSPAPWKDGSGAKPIFDFDFDAASAAVEWVAGIVRVPRQMLDDVKWLESFLRTYMLKSLYKAENDQILNGTGVSPQLKGLMPQAEAYDGEYTLFVEQLVDSAAQVNDNEHDANYILLNNRDAVKIALNKASGSGEYDLPPGTVGYVNGQLTIAGLNVVTLPTSQMARSNYLVGDFTATQLVTRLTPEIRFFEQNKDDVEKNMITIRIEERIALATYFSDAFVKNKTV